MSFTYCVVDKLLRFPIEILLVVHWLISGYFITFTRIKENEEMFYFSTCAVLRKDLWVAKKRSFFFYFNYTTHDDGLMFGYDISVCMYKSLDFRPIFCFFCFFSLRFVISAWSCVWLIYVFGEKMKKDFDFE